eukprot:Platyproteum_vivax@DN91_c0_g1_i1.p1
MSWRLLRKYSVCYHARNSGSGIFKNSCRDTLLPLRPYQFTIYETVMKRSSMDPVIAAVFTMCKDAWWRQLQNSKDAVGVASEQKHMVDMLEIAFNEKMQVVEAADTMLAGLNMLQLPLLAPNVAPIIIKTLLPKANMAHKLNTHQKEWDAIAMLEQLAHKVDSERLIVEHSTSQNQLKPSMQGDNNACLLMQQHEESILGDKQRRIAIVAHQLANVRNLLQEKLLT